MSAKPGYYAVAVGRKVGIYRTWDECRDLTQGFQGAVFKKCKTQAEAEQYIHNNSPKGRLISMSSNTYQFSNNLQAPTHQQQQPQQQLGSTFNQPIISKHNIESSNNNVQRTTTDNHSISNNFENLSLALNDQKPNNINNTFQHDVSTTISEPSVDNVPSKKKRGRPPKNAINESDVSLQQSSADETQKKRGRPKKVVNTNVAPQDDNTAQPTTKKAIKEQIDAEFAAKSAELSSSFDFSPLDELNSPSEKSPTTTKKVKKEKSPAPEKLKRVKKEERPSTARLDKIPITHMRSPYDYNTLINKARGQGNVIIIHSDGGSRPNPGACGSGVTVEFPVESIESNIDNRQPNNMFQQFELHSVSIAYGHGTNNWGELSGLGQAFEYIDQLDGTMNFDNNTKINLKDKQFLVFSDSVWALNIFTQNWNLKNEAYITPEITPFVPKFDNVRNKFDSKYGQGLYSFVWVKGHDGFEGNERVDELATRAIEYSQQYIPNGKFIPKGVVLKPQILTFQKFKNNTQNESIFPHHESSFTSPSYKKTKSKHTTFSTQMNTIRTKLHTTNKRNISHRTHTQKKKISKLKYQHPQKCKKSKPTKTKMF